MNAASINYQQMIFGFLGGLGLFLFYMKYMGDGLQMAAGDKLRYILDKYTTSPFLGVLVGILITALIQFRNDSNYNRTCRSGITDTSSSYRNCNGS